MSNPSQPVACVFDAYGTLFDLSSMQRSCVGLVGDRSEALLALWREKQLQYSWLRAAQGEFVDFWMVTGDALEFALDALKIGRPPLHGDLMSLYLTLNPFPEVRDMLSQLKQAGIGTAILSNGSAAMLKAVVDHADLGGLIDHVLSVDEVRTYKPDPRVYQLAVDRLGVPASAISFQSSNAWDAFAASTFGMKVIWCNRYGQRRERLPGRPDYEITSLVDVPKLVGMNRPV